MSGSQATSATLPARSASPVHGAVIDLTHVAKTYRGRVHALRGIEMHVRPGEIFGLLGPNGAGKSTLVKILMTVIRPTQCRGTLLGQPIGHKPTLRRVGYLPEHSRFAEYLTAAQVLDHYGALSRVPRRQRRRRAGELLDLVGMSEWANRRVRSYSKGMKQRVGLAQALINDPDLVLLDEPTDGLDPVGRRDVRAVLLELKSRGKTVFLNSHLLSELEMVCDRVAILVQGVVATQGTLDELTGGQHHYQIEAAIDGAPAPSDTLRELLKSRAAVHAGRLPEGVTVEVADGTVRAGTADPVAVQPLLDALRAGGCVIRALRPVRPSLEDLFMQAVTDPATGAVLKPGAAPDGRGKPAGGGAAC